MKECHRQLMGFKRPVMVTLWGSWRAAWSLRKRECSLRSGRSQSRWSLSTVDAWRGPTAGIGKRCSSELENCCLREPSIHQNQGRDFSSCTESGERMGCSKVTQVPADTFWTVGTCHLFQANRVFQEARRKTDPFICVKIYYNAWRKFYTHRRSSLVYIITHVRWDIPHSGE